MQGQFDEGISYRNVLVVLHYVQVPFLQSIHPGQIVQLTEKHSLNFYLLKSYLIILIFNIYMLFMKYV